MTTPNENQSIDNTSSAVYEKQLVEETIALLKSLRASIRLDGLLVQELREEGKR
jgi:hypothetical protein